MNEEKELVENINENKNKVEKKEKGGNHIVLIVFFLLFLGLIVFLAYKKLTYKPAAEITAVPAVNVTHIRKGKVEKRISVSGTILPSDTYYVPAKVGGDIKEIYVKNGDYVKKGDPICDIDASKEIEAAFITYDTAKKSFERIQALYNAGDVSKQDYESVKAQYDGAKLSYDTKVEYATPVAVGDGIIENTDMILNTAISAGKVLCYITSDSAKEINFGVTERVLAGIKVGDKVVVEKAGKTYEGYISNIASLINAQTGLFNVKAVITSENNFASGIMAKVTFVYDKRKNVDILDNDVVYYENGNAFVYTVKSDSTITKKYITVGLEDENRTEVLGGLTKNDKIICTWSKDLAEGTFINVVKDEKMEDELEIDEVDELIFETKCQSATESEILEKDIVYGDFSFDEIVFDGIVVDENACAEMYDSVATFSEAR